MRIKDWDTYTGHVCREWTCCGLVWQMLVVPAWEGSFANFRCPQCGAQEEPPLLDFEQHKDFAW